MHNMGKSAQALLSELNHGQNQRVGNFSQNLHGPLSLNMRQQATRIVCLHKLCPMVKHEPPCQHLLSSQIPSSMAFLPDSAHCRSLRVAFGRAQAEVPESDAYCHFKADLTIILGSQQDFLTLLHQCSGPLHEVCFIFLHSDSAFSMCETADETAANNSAFNAWSVA